MKQTLSSTLVLLGLLVLVLTGSTVAAQTTCPADSPFRCWDATCRKTPLDCPPLPACPAQTPHQCPSGKCVRYEDDCREAQAIGTVVFCGDHPGMSGSTSCVRSVSDSCQPR
jgi:hypothetical protein